jgi:hypothetical protein
MKVQVTKLALRTVTGVRISATRFEPMSASHSELPNVLSTSNVICSAFSPPLPSWMFPGFGRVNSSSAISAEYHRAAAVRTQQDGTATLLPDAIQTRQLNEFT